MTTWKGATMQYFKPKSVSFWSGLFSIIVATLIVLDIGKADQLGMIAEIITTLNGGGGSSPAMLYAIGFGLIGIRRRLD